MGLSIPPETSDRTLGKNPLCIFFIGLGASCLD